MNNLWLYSDVHVYVLPVAYCMFYTVCLQQISELSVDLESKQKEFQSVQEDKSSLEQQLTSLIRIEESQYMII